MLVGSVPLYAVTFRSCALYLYGNRAGRHRIQDEVERCFSFYGVWHRFFDAFFPQIIILGGHLIMKTCTYPSTVGVPKLALVGASGAGKSTLALKLLPQAISAATKIAGDSSAQTTLIPTHFYIRQSSGDLSMNTQLKLRITLRPFPSEGLRVDEDAVYAAVQHSITIFAMNSKGTGVPLSALSAYVDSGEYASDLCHVVNGAVRLEHFASDEQFRTCASECAEALLENFDTSAVDSSVSKMKGDAEKIQAKALALKGLLRQRWDEDYKKKDSRILALLRMVDQTVWGSLESLLPNIANSDTFSFDMSDENDRRVFTQLLDPHSPLSLVVEKYEVACGMGTAFQKVYQAQLENRLWLDERLPFRLVLMDTVGLDQDNPNDFDVAKRLRAALNSGCQGILLMLPPSLKDNEKRTIQRRFSTETDEGRRIKRNEIPLFLGIARADEEVTPKVDYEEDPDAYSQEMTRIWEKLSDIRVMWSSQFRAEDARYLTNQPKKIKAYLDDLKEINPDLAETYENHLGTESALDYLFEVTTKLQLQLFPSKKPIFFRASQQEPDDLHISLQVVKRDAVDEMAASLSEASREYCVPQWLHWNTAYAFRDATFGGYPFISRAVQNGRISLYIKGDVDKAARATKWGVTAFNDHVVLKHIDLTSPDSASLLKNLELDTVVVAEEDDVKRGLCKLFKDNFIGTSSWRFWRAIDAMVCRLSYTEPSIRDSAHKAFESGLRAEDANAGVVCLLDYYRNLYQNSKLAGAIEYILNDELTKEFNNFFFPLYD